ncbi:hypothetical protein WJ73_19490 [Burkholderia ubonensis]|nr:hypothetical protein WJ73_19490 [Burkholderia ubonensis]
MEDMALEQQNGSIVRKIRPYDGLDVRMTNLPREATRSDEVFGARLNGQMSISSERVDFALDDFSHTLFMAPYCISIDLACNQREHKNAYWICRQDD